MDKIITRKFILRPISRKDARDLAKNMNNWNVLRYLSQLPFPYEIKHAQEFIGRIEKEMKKEEPKDYVMVIEVNGEVVGAVGAHNMTCGHKAELGYWLAEQHWGNGIMTEAAKKFTSHVFSKFKLRRIYAKVYAPNKVSMKVLEKTGMKFEGVERKGALKDGKYIDCYVYSKVK